MPFSSITDPDKLALVCAAFDSAWSDLTARDERLLANQNERLRLAYVVAGIASTDPDGDLVARSIERFLETADTPPSPSPSP